VARADRLTAKDSYNPKGIILCVRFNRITYSQCAKNLVDR